MDFNWNQITINIRIVAAFVCVLWHDYFTIVYSQTEKKNVSSSLIEQGECITRLLCFSFSRWLNAVTWSMATWTNYCWSIFSTSIVFQPALPKPRDIGMKHQCVRGPENWSEQTKISNNREINELFSLPILFNSHFPFPWLCTCSNHELYIFTQE